MTSAQLVAIVFVKYGVASSVIINGTLARLRPSVYVWCKVLIPDVGERLQSPV